MTSITHADGAYFAQDVSVADGARLLELGWVRHAHDMRVWWTRSPYLAAPLWRHCDAAAMEAVRPWAWNYETSFATGPLDGTGVDSIRLPAGATPFPFQVAGIQRATMRKKILLGDMMGLGKDQPVDVKTATPNGWRPLGSLRPGDYVLGSDGVGTRVNGVYPQGIKATYRVTFSDHSSVEAGEDHLWTVRYFRGGKYWADMTLTTKQLRDRPVVGKVDLSKTALYLPLLSSPIQFGPQTYPLPIAPYTLGQLISNGSMGQRTTSIQLIINANDKYHVLSRLALDGHALGAQTTRDNTHIIGLLGMKPAIRYLKLEVTSGYKFVPDLYKLATPNERYALLHGLMDGDGSISKTGSKVTYHSTCERLAKDVQEVVEGLGGIASVRTYDRSHDGKPTEYQVRIRMPAGMNPFSTPRKASRYLPGRLALPCRTVSSVCYSRDVESVCIAVDAPDRLYVTEHCILTHNTIQACGVLNLARPKRTVVGCPAFLTRNWANEIERWCVDPQPIAILDGAKKALPDSGILILPYSRGHTFAEQIAAGPPIDLLIMDEVHFLKSSDARRTKCWLGEKGLARRADRVVALSGTPMPNNPLELYGLLSVLAPELLRGVTRDRFKELYCSTVELPMNRRNAIGQKIPIEKVSAKSTSVLNAELRASGVMVRRDKAEVLTQLPSKNIFFVHMQPDAEIETLVREEASLYDQLQMKLLSNKELMEVRGHVATVRQRLGVLKAPMIAEYVRNIFASGEDRVVVFMLHLEAIDEVRRAVGTTPDVEALVLTGSESPRVRQERVDKFQKPGGKRLIIGQTTAAGVGLTMTAARFGVLGEISWVPAWNEQAIDRLHRITQTKQVEIAVITFPHAIEERVVRANARKALDARAVLDENLMRLLDSAPEEALKTAAE